MMGIYIKQLTQRKKDRRASRGYVHNTYYNQTDYTTCKNMAKTSRAEHTRWKYAYNCKVCQKCSTIGKKPVHGTLKLYTNGYKKERRQNRDETAWVTGLTGYNILGTQMKTGHPNGNWIYTQNNNWVPK